MKEIPKEKNSEVSSFSQLLKYEFYFSHIGTDFMLSLFKNLPSRNLHQGSFFDFIALTNNSRSGDNQFNQGTFIKISENRTLRTMNHNLSAHQRTHGELQVNPKEDFVRKNTNNHLKKTLEGYR